MPTIIARRIKAELAKSRGANAIRASNLIQYITQAEDDEGAAKCTAIRTIGFADTNLTQEEIICQLKDDMDLARLKKHELLTHWVVSWKGEERPGHDEVFQAANELMAKLGYTDSHKQVFTIHENTEHIHIHIAACKVDMWSGKICGRVMAGTRTLPRKPL